MNEPIKVKDLIRMLERENQESYVHIAISSLADSGLTTSIIVVFDDCRE